MRRVLTLTAAAAATGAFLVAAAAAPAVADYAPATSDVVGIGGDTPQVDFNFAADGDWLGNLGYNAAGNAHKLVSFDAVADMNGRAGYANGSTLASPKKLNETITLRAGTRPVQRPQSSGAGISAILADTGHEIDYVRSARLPTAAEQATAAAKGYGYLHVVQIGTDEIQVVAAKTTNAPAGLSAQDLIGIYSGAYTTWGQLPGYTGPAPSDTIVPLLAPVGSILRSTFLADLKAANGGAAITLSPSVLTVEQNDPTAITNLPAGQKPNAVVTFSSARLALWANGYYRDPSVVFPGTPTAADPGVAARLGAPAAGTVYHSTVGHYVLYRQSDTAALGPWQPGSTKNWIETLFADPDGTPYLKKPAGQALIASAGATPAYSDLGNVSSG